ncbi:MAG: hypothetical protein ACR2QQ_12365, partial [Gammaproteobacteria bacterium]
MSRSIKLSVLVCLVMLAAEAFAQGPPLAVIRDINGNGSPDLAVLRTGTTVVEIRDGATGVP